MKDRNICKFIPATAAEQLKTFCYVLESNPKTMQTAFSLANHRAVLMKQGNGVFHIDDKTAEVSGGSLLFLFRDETVFAKLSDGAEYLYIDFAGNRAEALFQRFGIHKSCRLFPGFDGLLPLWQDSLARATELSIDLASESILLYTFSRLNSMQAEENKLLKQIVELTETQFTDPALSITSVANVLSYNPKYLSHFFKARFNISYSEYLRNMRIKYAITLFDHGIDSVKNVAYLSGFSDPLYFSSVFKRVVGMSPKMYKQTK
ncbi:MAG: AraC family transcriptional regulator [Clostridia bacterium]|nr:AraC family transcriptional regulator [Clostridia bacterium]